MDEEIENKETRFIDITRQMMFGVELVQDTYDLNALRPIINNIRDLLMSQGMTREEAQLFIDNEWYA